MRHKAEQFDLNWGEPEAFKLVVEASEDGERIAKAEAQRERDHQESEGQQTILITTKGTR